MDDRAGLTWAPEGFFEEMRPQWTIEPDMEIITTIVRRELHISRDSICSVKFLAKGTFNKVYAIHCEDNDNYVMRVSLPVQPRLKTLSELATIEYVRQHTNLPVPRVIAGSALNSNELGFEWMITQRVQGTKLSEQWRHMGWIKKQLLVRKVIDYQVQLFNKRFHQAGSLYPTASLQALPTAMIPDTALLGTEHSSDAAQYCIGQIISIPFFYHEHWKLDIARGPYKHSHDWFSARLQIAAVDVDNQPVYSDDDTQYDSEEDYDIGMGSDTDEATDTAKISIDTANEEGTENIDMGGNDKNIDDIDSDENDDNNDDDNEVETDPGVLLTAKSKFSRIQRLIKLLPKVFPKSQPEEYILAHQDLSGNNILVDEDHGLSGIIDWECVNTVPLWLGCQIPKFLRSPAEDEPPPLRTEFRDEWDEKDYWRRIEEHEKTQLRKYYLEEMQRVCPEWARVHKAGAIKADFDFAASIVALGATVDFELWLKQVEQDQVPLAFRSAMGQI